MWRQRLWRHLWRVPDGTDVQQRDVRSHVVSAAVRGTSVWAGWVRRDVWRVPVERVVQPDDRTVLHSQLRGTLVRPRRLRRNLRCLHWQPGVRYGPRELYADLHAVLCGT